MLPWLLAAAATFVAVLVGFAWASARTRARDLAAQVHAAVAPYRRRKAAEAGVVGAAATWTSRATPEQIVGHSARVARQLLEIERLGPVPTSTRELEVAKTQPLADADMVVTDKQRK